MVLSVVLLVAILVLSKHKGTTASTVALHHGLMHRISLVLRTLRMNSIFVVFLVEN